MSFINDLLLTFVLKIIRDISLNLSYNFFEIPKPQLNDHCSLMTDCCGCGRLRFFHTCNTVIAFMFLKKCSIEKWWWCFILMISFICVTVHRGYNQLLSYALQPMAARPDERNEAVCWLCDQQRSEEKKAAASATTPPCQPDRSAKEAAAAPT